MDQQVKNRSTEKFWKKCGWKKDLHLSKYCYVILCNVHAIGNGVRVSKNIVIKM